MERSEVVSSAFQQLQQQAAGWNNSVGLLRQSLGGVLNRAQQNISQSVAEATGSVTRQFVDQLGNELSDLSQAWVDDATGQLTVVPEGTKFFNREGSTMNCLVELKPTCRTIRFLGRNYYLSLPYTQFNCVFSRAPGSRSMTLQHLMASCSKRSVTSLEDSVNPLPLPNVGYGGSFRVCVGSMELGSTVNIVDRVEQVIGSFWQSEFNTDLANGMVGFLRDNFSLEPSNVNTTTLHAKLAEWEAKSRANPLWAVSEEARYGSAQRVGSLVQGEMNTRQGKTAFKARMRQTITQNISSLAERASQELRNVSVVSDNVESIHREAINNEVRGTLARGFDILNREMTTALQVDRANFATEVQRTTNSLQRRERNLESNKNSFAEEKRLWEAEKLRIQLELHKANEYLKARIAQVEGRAVPTPPAPTLGTILAETPQAPRAPRTRRPRAVVAEAPAPAPVDPVAVLDEATQTQRANRPGAQRTPGVSWRDVVASLRQQAPADPFRRDLETRQQLDRAALQAAVQAWREMGTAAPAPAPAPVAPAPAPAPAPVAPAPAPAPAPVATAPAPAPAPVAPAPRNRGRGLDLADIGLDLIVGGIV